MLQVLVLLYLSRDRKAGRRTSGLLLIFWLLMLIYATIKLRTYILTAMDHVSVGVAVGGLGMCIYF